jgi:phenylacetate-CoA ligase
MISDTPYDSLEIRSVDDREQSFFSTLPNYLKDAKSKSKYYGDAYRDVDPDTVIDRNALAKLPVVRKSSLYEIQKSGDPLGGLLTVRDGDLVRIFQSPGPTYDAEGKGDDWWGTARALHASGLRSGDILHNSFSYHMTPAGLMMETGARAIGAAVFPAGIGNTELQVQAIHDVRATCYTGTPSYLKKILETAASLGKDTSSLKIACVGGEGLPPDLRASIEDHGIHCGQVYASADLGSVAYESIAREGLIVDERLIVEIVRPGTGDPVPEGEVGEVVVTVMRSDYPLIRFATGDLSAVLPGSSPCGRTNMRLKGWMGRADQTTKVKGMFVHPAQIAELVRRHPEIERARAVVSKQNDEDVLTVQFEASVDDAGFADAVSETILNVCKLRGTAEVHPVGSLPNDGKVIDDVRDV